MITYGNFKAPLGMVGDPDIVNKHDKPMKERAENWLNLAHDEQNANIALAYLNALGADTISKLGYSYEYLRGSVSNEAAVVNKKLIPWEIALKDPDKQNLKERYIVRRAQIYKHNQGYIKKRIALVWHFAKYVHRGLTSACPGLNRSIQWWRLKCEMCHD